MDPKQISFGVAVVLASVGGAAVVSSPKTEQVYVAASEKVDDKMIEQVAPLGTDEGLLCERQWAYVTGKEPTLGWMCGGAWIKASEQEAMNDRFGKDAVRVRFSYAPDGEGLKANAEVTTGPIPEEPAPLPEPKPVVKAETQPVEGELVP